MQRLLLLTAACLAAGALQAQSPSRFSGGATLAGPAGISTHARFKLDATAFPPGTDFSEAKNFAVDSFAKANKLQPSISAPATAPKALEQLGGRFGLTAALNNPNAPTVACTTGADPIFKNGFE
jgi:hypothetical protein